MTSIKKVLINILKGVAAFSIVLLTAVFLFASFYNYMVPDSTAHSYTVYMNFDSRYGTAHYGFVKLSQQGQNLLSSQSYKVYLSIDVATSPPESHMFVMCAYMKSEYKLRDSSCQTAFIEHESKSIELVKNIMKVPIYVFGLPPQSMKINVELFNDFMDVDENHPITYVIVKIKEVNFKYYSIRLNFIANLTGVIYALVHWPLFSAIIGISAISFSMWVLILTIIICLKYQVSLTYRVATRVYNISGRRNIHDN